MKTASAQHITREEFDALYQSPDALFERVVSSLSAVESRCATLEAELQFFRKQIFGERSEKRSKDTDPRQLSLGEFTENAPPPEPTETVTSYERRVRRDAPNDDVEESPIRFDDSVPVKEIELLPDEAKNLEPYQYEVISTEYSHRLAQRPGSYVVLRYARRLVKLKESGDLRQKPAPSSVFDRSMADVSVVAGMLIDKVQYHLPLFRQHQRMAACGVNISRGTLTNWFHRASDLLRPVYEAQLHSILQSEVLLMDETPVKAGQAASRGKMHKGYFWPVLGDKQEVAFPYFPTRGKKPVEELLGKFAKTLVTDGYEVYETVAAARAEVVHAQCWVHARRTFIEAEKTEPELVHRALDYIGELYRIEATIKDKPPDVRRNIREEQSRPVVDQFFSWLDAEQQKRLLLPSNLFLKALTYALTRERALRVFLDDPAVPMDTNELERAIRPIPLGRKNWLFCWTEIGAEYLGIVQSLISTCRLHDVDPYTYLVGALQRVAIHPALDVIELTPRLWKELFARNPLRSDLDSLKRSLPS